MTLTFDALAAALVRLGSRLNRGMSTAVRRLADLGLAEARRRAPVVSGEFVGSIGAGLGVPSHQAEAASDLPGDGLSVPTYFGADADHAPFLEPPRPSSPRAPEGVFTPAVAEVERRAAGVIEEALGDVR